MAQKADQTAYEGEGGGYYAWSVAKTPLLSEFKLGAGNLLLHPHGFALPHYADSSKIGYVVQGACTVGLVSPNSSEEKVVLIKKGDAIPLSMGDISWWFNGGDTDVNIVFLGESAKAQVSGQFTYFFVAGTLGILRGLQPDFVGKAFNLDEKESENIMNSQPAALITKLRNEVIFPKPNKHVSDKIYATIDTPSADIVVKGGGIVNLLTEKELPTIGRIGLSAKFVRLEGNAMLAPSYTADGSIQMIYDVKGSGWVRAAGADGNPALDTKVQEGEMLIVPQFLVAAVVADECGMEIFSVVTSSMPVFGEFAGKTSVWNALHPVVLQSTLNIGQESVEVFKSKNAKTITIVPPSN